MISPKAVVAMLALAGTAVAQEKSDEQRIVELIEQLKDERAHGTATAELLKIGRPVLPQMVQALTAQVEPSHAEQILEVLGGMRASADDTITQLMEAYSTSDLATLPAFIRAVADLAPYWSSHPYQDLHQMTRPILGNDAWDLLRTAPPEIGAAILNERERLKWRVSGSLILPTKEKLLSLLYSELAYRQELGAELLGQMGERAYPELQDLWVFLSQESPFVVKGWNPEDLTNLYFSSDGTLITVPPTSDISYDVQLKGAIANAMEKIAPNEPTILTVVEAYRLVHDPDPFRRFTAATLLGQYGREAEQAVYAVPSLLKVLENPDDRVAAEAITAMGMIGPAARDAIPTLEKLTEHEDPQIAERAKAALRQVRGK